jgi:hypothetical protein
MVKTSDLIILSAMAIGGYLLYRTYKTAIGKPLTDEQGVQALSSAGATVYPSTTTEGATMVTAGDTTFKFLPGEFGLLNPAQKILIGVDRIIPGTWLTEKVLT